MDREIEYHLERLAQDYIAQGMAPEEAHRRARLEFGGPAEWAAPPTTGTSKYLWKGSLLCRAHGERRPR